LDTGALIFFYNNPKCEKLKVSDLRPGRLEYIGNLFPDISTTTDSSSLLEDRDIDAIVVATPVNTHRSIAIEALKNDKHVFIEKPLTDNYDDACEVVEFARTQKKVVRRGLILDLLMLR
jgi:predicted dehydrogenase